MKAITIHQPWASLIAFGEKHYETRSWSTAYRGPLVIHASKRFTMDRKCSCWQSPCARVLIRHGITAPADLPLGRGLCIVNLVEMWKTTTLRVALTDQERAFGDYAPGRFAWQLELFEVFDKPIPCVGRQGLWTWRRP